MPAVSVIIPVYKVEEYIERCARYLMNQTLQDIEFVFVDDCTPDRSMDILVQVLDEFPERKHQVKIIRNEENKGLPFTRSVGVKHASGDYIIHCDSDDWPEIDMYLKMYLKAKNENLDIVICRTCCVYPDHIEYAPDILGSEDLLGSLIRQDMYNHLTDKLISRKAYEKGVVYPVGDMSEDTAILIQLVGNSNSFGYIYEPLYNYTVREGSICHTVFDQEKIEKMRQNYEVAFSYLEEKGLSKKHKRDIIGLKCWLRAICQDFPRSYYMKIYPETNIPFLFNRRFTPMQRLGHLTKLMGIHGISRLYKRNNK